MKIAIGCDQNGYALKSQLIKLSTKKKYQICRLRIKRGGISILS